MTPYRERVFPPEPSGPRRRGALWALLAVVALGATARSTRAPAPAVSAVVPQQREPRRVAYLSAGRGRVLIAATDGTTWSIPERGVEVNGERRMLPVRERFTEARAIVEDDEHTVFTLGFDGRVRRYDRRWPGGVVFADVGRVTQMEVLEPNPFASSNRRCDLGDPRTPWCPPIHERCPFPKTALLLDARGGAHVRSIARETSVVDGRLPIDGRVTALLTLGEVGCALTDEGAVWCFNSTDWITGDNTVRAPSAVRVGVARRVDDTARGNGEACFVTPSRQVWCVNLWSVTPAVSLTQMYSYLRSAFSRPQQGETRGERRCRSVRHAPFYDGDDLCALSLDDRVRCTGIARGDGVRRGVTVPVPILRDVEIRSVSFGAGSVYAIDAAGGVWAAGVGDAGAATRLVRVAGLPPVAWVTYDGPGGIDPGPFVAVGQDASLWTLPEPYRLFAPGGMLLLQPHRVFPPGWMRHARRVIPHGFSVHLPDGRGDAVGHSPEYPFILGERIDFERPPTVASDCEVRSGGSVWCARWDRDDDRTRWHRVPGVHGAVGAQSRFGFGTECDADGVVDGCAWSRDTLWCWGDDRRGQLNDGRHEDIDAWAEFTLPQG